MKVETWGESTLLSVQQGLLQIGWVLVAVAGVLVLGYALFVGWRVVAVTVRRVAAGRLRTLPTPGRWPSESPS
ncbi:MAG: hypothetical protein WA892_05630 [Ornithinimicrobium sp.]